jgi:hypothetical protein
VLNLGMESPRGLLAFGKYCLLPLGGHTEVFDFLSYSLRRTDDLTAVLFDTIFACFRGTI